MTDSLVSIASGGISADINPLGAELFGLRNAAGHDLLWNGDPAIWSGRAPILFPIIGELKDGQYQWGGKTYRLARHGFARKKLFTLAQTTPARALFRLAADDETLAAYPFAFELDLEFTVADTSLTIIARAKNKGDGPMPASFGFHPALRWPLPYGQPRADHAITFEKDEPAPVRRLDAHGLVLPDAMPAPLVNRKLALRDDLFANDALIFDRPASRAVRYGASTGPQLQVRFDDMPMLGIWTKPGANYICIEPWHGIADPQAGYDGDLGAKPGIVMVPPGGALTCRMSIGISG